MKFSSIILSYTLSFMILFSSMQVSLTYAYYEIDPIGFIEQLCENKDQPELACNGKCQLKKVAESNSSDNKTPLNLLDFKEILLFNEGHEPYQITILSDRYNLDHFYLNLYSYTNLNDCFHPPQTVFS